MMMSNERFHWSLIWKTFDLGQTFEFGNETTRSEFGSRGKPEWYRVPAWYRAAGSPSVAHELEPAPALAWPVDARNRDAEGGSLRGPNRPVLAARALPTPEGWPAAA